MIMRLRTLITVAAMIVLAASLTPPASASSYAVQLDGDKFRVVWEVDAMQNLTALSKTMVFPQNLSYAMTGADLTAFNSALRTALQSRILTVVITQPAVSLSSSGVNVTCSFHCPLQWLNVTVAFDVQEPTTLAAGAGRYDLSWMAFRLAENLEAAGQAFNTLGQSYLIQAMPSFFPSPTPGRTFTVKVGGLLVSKADYQAPVQEIVLLDTSSLVTPLEEWAHSQDLNAGTQTWRSPNDAGFNITAIQQITEVDLITNIYYFAAARVSAEFSAPLTAHAQGNVLIVDLSNGLWEGAAAFIVVAALATLIVTTILDRKLTRSSRRRKASRSH